MNFGILVILRRKLFKYWKILSLFFVLIYSYIIIDNIQRREESKQKFVLIWTPSSDETHFSGTQELIKNRFIKFQNCSKQCYLTESRIAFSSYTQFDAIVFHAQGVFNRCRHYLPKRRNRKQLYIFASKVPSNKYQTRDPKYDGFFNWTWTYKLDSDILSTKVIVKEIESGLIIAPNIVMHWPIHLDRKVPDEVAEEITRKKDAVVWCIDSKVINHKIVLLIEKQLQIHFWSVDIFKNCFDLDGYTFLPDTYYFMLAFQSVDFVEDFFTENVFNALQNFIVPIVFGPVNYTKFLPPGSYLDATKLAPARLVHMILRAMNNHTFYSEFFQWRNHYGIEKPKETDEMCALCLKLHDPDLPTSIHYNFREWWWANESMQEDFRKRVDRFSPDYPFK